MIGVEYIFVGAGALLLLSIFASKTSGRVGVPAFFSFSLSVRTDKIIGKDKFFIFFVLTVLFGKMNTNIQFGGWG